MNKRSLFLVGTLLIGSMALAGCGSGAVTTSVSGSSGGSSGGSGGGSSGDTSGGSSTPSSVTLAGTISSGGSTALPDGYIITATDVATGKTTKATITSGKYSLTLDTTKTYVFVILDNNNREVAVVTGSDVQTILSEKFVVSGFKMASSESSGNITLNEVSGSAFWGGSLKSSLSLLPVDKYIARASSSGTALATGGSSGNFGGGSSTAATSSTATLEGDRDADGFPDMFDADANGNGTPDSQESTRLTNKLLGSDRIDSVTLFAASNDTGSADLVLRLYPKSAAASKIKSVKLVASESPSYVTSATVHANSTDVSDSSFPSGGLKEGTTWKSIDYTLYKQTPPHDSTHWGIVASPSSTVKVGDTLTLEVTYTDKTTTDKVTAIVDFVITKSTTLTALNTKMPSTLGSGTAANPYVLDSDTVTFTWTRPTDKDGNKAFGMRYKISVIFYDSSGNSLGIEEQPQDSSKNFSAAVDTDSTASTVNATVSLKTVMKDSKGVDQAVAKRKTVSIDPVDLLSTGRGIQSFDISTPVSSTSTGGGDRNQQTGSGAVTVKSINGTALASLTGSGTTSDPYKVGSGSTITFGFSPKSTTSQNSYMIKAEYTLSGGTTKSDYLPSPDSGFSDDGKGSDVSKAVTFKTTFDGVTITKRSYQIVLASDKNTGLLKNAVFVTNQ